MRSDLSRIVKNARVAITCKQANLVDIFEDKAKIALNDFLKKNPNEAMYHIFTLDILWIDTDSFKSIAIGDIGAWETREDTFENGFYVPYKYCERQEIDFGHYGSSEAIILLPFIQELIDRGYEVIQSFEGNDLVVLIQAS